ncbi:MAG: hypothetical protein RBS56_03195 [Candidatus Gracilibacteria bacterium]|jgi:hypothetical protein|nr:hypothetical protein [Candidatus Gracilibacteria bacterium]
MEKIEYKKIRLFSNNPMPQHILLTADFILEKIRINPKKDEENEISLIRQAVGTYIPDEDFDADHIRYLWKKLKFKIKPKKGHKIEDHDRISLARAIYVYENFLEVRPEGKDRLPLDEAIEEFMGKEKKESKFIDEAKNIFYEAKKYSEKVGKRLLPFDFKFFMKDLSYDEKDTLSIINYYRDLRESIRPINLENENELTMFSKALELNKTKGRYTSIKVVHIGDDTRQNVMMFLTAPEKPKKKPDQK